MENKPLDDPWENKINNKPDYVRITEAKIELFKKFWGEDFVSKNFGIFLFQVYAMH
jgi:hypothetical protein